MGQQEEHPISRRRGIRTGATSTVRNKPAILEKTGDVSYQGHIREEAEECYVSFPGKYASGWDALTKERHNYSVACVFLCTPEDGLGQHHHEETFGPCLCHTIYGERSYKQFGYLKVVPGTLTDDEVTLEREKAKHTKTVVIRADASEEAKEIAETEAKEAWEKNGKVASWGCQWFQDWKKKVEEAVKLKQRLKVVFFPGEVGQGKVCWEDLSSKGVDLWNNIGCGGSQKCEIAHLEKMRKEKGDDWAYDCVDATHFLKDEFKVGGKVDAFDGQQWWNGTLLGVPKTVPKDPKDAKWVIQSQAGEIFATDRLRHADLMRQMLADVGQEKFLGFVKSALPKGLEVKNPCEFIFRDGTPSLAVRLDIKSIQALQVVRNEVLSTDLEVLVNKELELHSKWQVRLDKTYFCKVFEKELLTFSELTQHQKEKLENIEDLLRNGAVRLSAPAGAGKTFVAVQCACNKITKRSEGLVLFAAPSIGLGLYFFQWLAQRCARDLSLENVLNRIVLMTWPYESFLSLHDEGGILKPRCLSENKMQFILAIVDEAHDVFRSTEYDSFFNFKVEAEQCLLLSSKSQASGDECTFTGVTELKLTEIVRSTKRIVAGSAAFQGSAEEKEGVASLCPAGPPLKTFLFESDRDTVDYEKYAEKTVAALWDLMGSYAGLSFHRRLALLVPKDFLQNFKQRIQDHFAHRFAGRNFVLASFQDSLAVLPHREEKQTTAEVIILDTVENCKGLEQLIIICIGLDEKLGNPKTNSETRASIYQAITRAQLQAVVVNQRLRGGWFEFLGLVKFNDELFDESSAMAETSTRAAALSISDQIKPLRIDVASLEDKGGSGKLPILEESEALSDHAIDQEVDSRLTTCCALVFRYFSRASHSQVQPDPHPTSDGGDPPRRGDIPSSKAKGWPGEVIFPPTLESSESSEALIPEVQLGVQDSSVWDTEHNDIKPIQQLEFDPREVGLPRWRPWPPDVNLEDHDSIRAAMRAERRIPGYPSTCFGSCMRKAARSSKVGAPCMPYTFRCSLDLATSKDCDSSKRCQSFRSLCGLSEAEVTDCVMLGAQQLFANMPNAKMFGWRAGLY
eukprot:s3795_g5.t1